MVFFNIKIKIISQAGTQFPILVFPAVVFAIFFCLMLPHTEQVFVVEI